MPSKLYILTSTTRRLPSIPKFLNTLYGTDHKFHTLQIVTGYWDSNAIRQTISWAQKRKSLGANVRFELYLNATNRKKPLDELISLNDQITKHFKDPDSGIYFIVGGFLHMKAYHIRGNSKAVFSIGSNNFTENSILNNEEALIYSTFDPRTPNSSANKQVKTLVEYLGKLKSNAYRSSGVSAIYIGEMDKTYEKYQSLVEYLLNHGELWSELKATSPYQLQLYLPEDLLKAAAPNFDALEPYIDAETENSINVRRLINRCRELHRDMEFCYQKVLEEHKGAELKKGANNWTKYAIETSLGYWAPLDYRRFIELELNKQKYKEIEHLANLELLLRYPKELKHEFMQFVDGVIDTIVSEGIITTIRSPWYTGGLHSVAIERRREIRDYWSERWTKHICNLKEKLGDDEFRIRLVRGISSIPVPDMRSDKFVLDGFVDSFLSSFEYHSNMKRVHKTLCRDDDVKQLVMRHTENTS